MCGDFNLSVCVCDWLGFRVVVIMFKGRDFSFDCPKYVDFDDHRTFELCDGEMDSYWRTRMAAERTMDGGEGGGNENQVPTDLSIDSMSDDSFRTPEKTLPPNDSRNDAYFTSDSKCAYSLRSTTERILTIKGETPYRESGRRVSSYRRSRTHRRTPLASKQTINSEDKENQDTTLPQKICKALFVDDSEQVKPDCVIEIESIPENKENQDDILAQNISEALPVDDCEPVKNDQTIEIESVPENKENQDGILAQNISEALSVDDCGPVKKDQTIEIESFPVDEENQQEIFSQDMCIASSVGDDESIEPNRVIEIESLAEGRDNQDEILAQNISKTSSIDNSEQVKANQTVEIESFPEDREDPDEILKQSICNSPSVDDGEQVKANQAIGVESFPEVPLIKEDQDEILEQNTRENSSVDDGEQMKLNRTIEIGSFLEDKENQDEILAQNICKALFIDDNEQVKPCQVIRSIPEVVIDIEESLIVEESENQILSSDGNDVDSTESCLKVVPDAENKHHPRPMKKSSTFTRNPFKVGRYKTLAELEKEFERTTRIYPHTPCESRWAKKPLTQPRSPKLSAMKRVRQNHCTTHGEQEENLAEDIRKNGFKATPFNKEKFGLKGDSLFKRLDRTRLYPRTPYESRWIKKPLTQPRSPKFSVVKRCRRAHCTTHGEEEERLAEDIRKNGFKATPFNREKFGLKSDSLFKRPKPIPFTKPKPFAFLSDKRIRKPNSASSTNNSPNKK